MYPLDLSSYSAQYGYASSNYGGWNSGSDTKVAGPQGGIDFPAGKTGQVEQYSTYQTDLAEAGSAWDHKDTANGLCGTYDPTGHKLFYAA